MNSPLCRSPADQLLMTPCTQPAASPEGFTGCIPAPASLPPAPWAPVQPHHHPLTAGTPLCSRPSAADLPSGVISLYDKLLLSLSAQRISRPSTARSPRSSPASRISPPLSRWPSLVSLLSSSSFPPELPFPAGGQCSQEPLSSACLCSPAPRPATPLSWCAPSHLAFQGAAQMPLSASKPSRSQQPDTPLPPCVPPTSHTSLLAVPRLLVVIKHTIPLFTTPQIRVPVKAVKFYFLKWGIKEQNKMSKQILASTTLV